MLNVGVYKTKSMTDKQKEFLRLAVIDKLTYSEIESQIGLSRDEFSPWWDEFKLERTHLTLIRDKWQIKCPEIKFDDFKDWYESADKKCFYCNITEEDTAKLWSKFPDLTKRKRGKKLEIERLEPNLPYNITANLVFSCYWCNNAKTDTFTKDEFIQVGKVFEKIWENRLK
jgi:hypothetical protein